MYNMAGNYGNSLQFWAYDQTAWAPGGMCQPVMTLTDKGNVGIKASVADIDDSGALLYVAGTAVVKDELRIDRASGTDGIGSYLTIRNTSKTLANTGYSWRMYNMTEGYGNSLQFWVYDQKEWNGGMCKPVMTLTDKGKVGIKASVDLIDNSDALLYVAGKIIATEVEVKNVGADFVFEKDYKLKSLEEVETYINENQHLPGIAPASETTKGVELARFNTMLLQKVEELTLYAITQQKFIQEMQARLDKLEGNKK
jgi:hypothetical protein